MAQNEVLLWQGPCRVWRICQPSNDAVHGETPVWREIPSGDVYLLWNKERNVYRFFAPSKDMVQLSQQRLEKRMQADLVAAAGPSDGPAVAPVGSAFPGLRMHVVSSEDASASKAGSVSPSQPPPHAAAASLGNAPAIHSAIHADLDVQVGADGCWLQWQDENFVYGLQFTPEAAAGFQEVWHRVWHHDLLAPFWTESDDGISMQLEACTLEQAVDIMCCHQQRNDDVATVLVSTHTIYTTSETLWQSLQAKYQQLDSVGDDSVFYRLRKKRIIHAMELWISTSLLQFHTYASCVTLAEAFASRLAQSVDPTYRSWGERLQHLLAQDGVVPRVGPASTAMAPVTGTGGGSRDGNGSGTTIETTSSTRAPPSNPVSPRDHLSDADATEPASGKRSKRSSDDSVLRSAMSPRSVLANGNAQPILPINLRGHLKLLDVHPLELARQLTLLESVFIGAIQRRELKHAAWTKEGARECCPNVFLLKEWFNNVVFFLATTVLRESAMSARVSHFIQFIRLADALLTLGNFNGALEVFATLNLGSIQKLKTSWAEVPAKEMARLKSIENVLSPTRNYSQLRSRVSSFISQAAPLLPPITMILTDLLIAEEIPDTAPNGFINMHKMRILARVFMMLAQGQHSKWEFEPVAFIGDWLQGAVNDAAQRMTEDECWDAAAELSQQAAPRRLTRSISSLTGWSEALHTAPGMDATAAATASLSPRALRRRRRRTAGSMTLPMAGSAQAFPAKRTSSTEDVREVSLSARDDTEAWRLRRSRSMMDGMVVDPLCPRPDASAAKQGKRGAWRRRASAEGRGVLKKGIKWLGRRLSGRVRPNSSSDEGEAYASQSPSLTSGDVSVSADTSSEGDNLRCRGSLSRTSESSAVFEPIPEHDAGSEEEEDEEDEATAADAAVSKGRVRKDEDAGNAEPFTLLTSNPNLANDD